MTTRSYAEVRRDALEALDGGDARAAFQKFREVLTFPGRLSGAEEWRDAFGVFARDGEGVAGPEVGSKARRGADHPDGVHGPYNLAYELIEHGLTRVGSTALARATALAP